VVGEHGVALALVDRLDIGSVAPTLKVCDPPLETLVHDLLVQTGW
jgi:hypothetical protein